MRGGERRGGGNQSGQAGGLTQTGRERQGKHVKNGAEQKTRRERERERDKGGVRKVQRRERDLKSVICICVRLCAVSV